MMTSQDLRKALPWPGSLPHIVLCLVISLSLLSSLTVVNAFAPHTFSITIFRATSVVPQAKWAFFMNDEKKSSTTETAYASTPTTSESTPILNGKRVLPWKIVMGALKGQKPIAAVYAVLNSSYQRGTEGWDCVTYTGVSQNLSQTLQQVQEQDTTQLKVAHVRALSFTFPEPNTMQQIASDWRQQAKQANAQLDESWASAYLFDNDDDDEEEEENDDTLPDGTVISPFVTGALGKESVKSISLEFTSNNVEHILDQVRPYLISDGGNVALESIDASTRCVVLKLQGACGSCASSTITMQMGIERVLKEQWPDVEVVQAVTNTEPEVTKLSREAVETEVSRLRPALIALGSTVRLVDADAESGVVTIEFKGGSKVRSGLELAIRDVPFVQDVVFLDPTE